MTRSELQEYDASEPIWGFVAQLGRERFTGQADVGVSPRVELFVSEGRVYFAQKVDDPPLGARLVAAGALTTEQLSHGCVQVGDTLSLARLFSRVPSLDRDAIELITARFTEQVLESVAQSPVGDRALHPFRHHPSGIHQWSSDVEPETEPVGADPAFAALVADVVAQVSGEVPVIETETDLEPAPASMTFDTMVTTPPEPEAALPTLSTLSGLTPLPTLGEVGTRMPTPTMVHAPSPMQARELPSLGQVGVSFDPRAIAKAEADAEAAVAAEAAGAQAAVEAAAAAQAAEAAEAAAVAEATAVTIADPTIAELEAMVGAPSAAPHARLIPLAPDLELIPGSPLPPPVVPPGLSPLDLPSFGAMMTSATPTANSAAAPAEETEQIWDMVDDLLGLPHTDANLVDAGSHESEKKGRGWLRGRRG
jgi:hypothetical protein